MSNPNRAPRGIPTGGQFAASSKPASSVELNQTSGPVMSESEVAIRNLIDHHFGGDSTGAILAMSRQAGIAVAYQDRKTIEAGFRDLDNEEWARLQPHLENYDEWLDNSGAAESLAYWRDDALRRADIVFDPCRSCGADASGGEGYDGQCGSCADRDDAAPECTACDAALYEDDEGGKCGDCRNGEPGALAGGTIPADAATAEHKAKLRAETPTASPAVFLADLNRMNAAIDDAGARIQLTDGAFAVDESKMPPAFSSAYRNLTIYGYANGLLP